ncbi:tetratricopeptide repeat protein [Moraxella sp. ZY210820]|uniref:tetratricopeptide repeat protein n=1 Tax=unclassified Moraxella TaxID=2685852 RepID=UPI00351F3722
MLFSSNIWANSANLSKNHTNTTQTSQKQAKITQKNALELAFIGEFHAQNGDLTSAVDAYTPLALYTPSTSAKRRALELSLEDHQLDIAFIVADTWVKQEPKDVPALFYLAHTTLKTHRYTRFAQVLENILQIDKNANLDQILTGILPENQQDRLELLETLKQIKYSNNPSLLVLIATLQAQEQQFNEALINVNKALRKRPKTTSFILLKANLLIAMEHYDEALKWLKKSNNRYKRNPDIRLAEIQLLIEKNQEDVALQRIENALKYNPNADDILFLASLTNIDHQRYQKAEQYLLKIQQSERYHNDANYYLGINAERQKHLEDALIYYRQVDGNLYMASRQAMIKIYQQLNQVDEAIRFLTQERVNYPSHASFLYQAQADLLQQVGRKQQALQLLQEASQDLAEDPDLLYAQVLLLNPYQEQKRLDQVLNQLLLLEPNNPNYLNAYAYTLALQNRDLKRARTFAENALAQDPTQPSFLDTLGYIAFLQNDFKTAIQSLSQAYEYAPSASIGTKYAHALYMHGNLDKFTQLVQQLKQKYPDNEQILQLDMLILPDHHQSESSNSKS